MNNKILTRTRGIIVALFTITATHSFCVEPIHSEKPTRQIIRTSQGVSISVGKNTMQGRQKFNKAYIKECQQASKNNKELFFKFLTLIDYIAEKERWASYEKLNKHQTNRPHQIIRFLDKASPYLSTTSFFGLLRVLPRYTGENLSGLALTIGGSVLGFFFVRGVCNELCTSEIKKFKLKKAEFISEAMRFAEMQQFVRNIKHGFQEE